MIRGRIGSRWSGARDGARSAPATPGPAAGGDDRRLFLSHSEVSVGPRDRLLIAGVVRPATVAALEPDARVDVMLPHDALLVLERADPDLVLVESAALARGGSWGFAGDPSVADHAQRLLDILVTARSLGRPTVLWWNGPSSAAPALIPFEPQFTFVATADPSGDDDPAVPWSPGVQLGRFDGIALDPDRPMRPIFAGGWEPGAPRWDRSFATAALAAVAPEGLEIWLDGDADSGSLPEALRPSLTRRFHPPAAAATYRESGLFLADPLARRGPAGAVAPAMLRQLASGARVVSGPNAALAAAIADGVTWMAAPVDAVSAVRDAIDQGPIRADEHRIIRRTLFERHATAVAVADLARSLGLRDYPSRARQACAVVRLDDDVRADAFVDGILAQRHRPSDAILCSADPVTARVAIAELEAAGVAARWQGPDAAGRYGLAALAAGTAAGWLWSWVPERRLEQTLLLDLLVGAAISDADAIGWIDGDEDAFVGALPIAGSIVSRRAAIGRPEPLDGGLAEWVRRGARLFGLGTGASAGSSPAR